MGRLTFLQFTSGSICMALLASMAGLALNAQVTPTYSVVAEWPVPGGGGWDYLHTDPARHLLYITHGTQVQVLDTHSGKLIATIGGLKRAHDVALAPDGKLGYISDGDADQVIVFDRTSYAKVKTIPVAIDPDGLVFEPTTHTVWALNGRSNDATIIDAGTQKVVATVKVPGKPEYPQADGEGNVFVNIESRKSIARFNAKTRTQTAEWPLPGCDSPTGLTVDRAHHRLFAVCDGKVMAAVDAASGKLLKLIPIGDGPDAVRYDAKRELVFSSNEDGTLTVVSSRNDAFKVVQTVKTEPSGRTMALDSETGRAFVLVARFGPKPPPTKLTPDPRPTGRPGTFKVLVLAPR